MKEVSGDAIRDDAREVRLFARVRNERLRLANFLTHYRRLGVRRFFFIDNDSTDGTRDLLSTQPDVHLFWTPDSYSEAGSVTAWVESLLNTYGCGHWCLVVDADELLVYPHCELLSLTELCDHLDREGATALFAILLDMYSAKPIVETVYESGAELAQTCPFFDAANLTFSGYSNYSAGGIPIAKGGMRKRVFGIDAALNKAPLIRYAPGISILSGMHAAEHVTLSSVTGALLHFKFLDDFVQRIKEEEARKQHWNQSQEYKIYFEVMNKEPSLTAFNARSVRYVNSSSLLARKIIVTSESLEALASSKKNSNVPAIPHFPL